MQSYCDHMTHSDTVEVNQDEVGVSNEIFSSKHFIHSFISLEAQNKRSTCEVFWKF